MNFCLPWLVGPLSRAVPVPNGLNWLVRAFKWGSYSLLTMIWDDSPSVHQTRLNSPSCSVPCLLLFCHVGHSAFPNRLEASHTILEAALGAAVGGQRWMGLVSGHLKNTCAPIIIKAKNCFKQMWWICCYLSIQGLGTRNSCFSSICRHGGDGLPSSAVEACGNSRRNSGLTQKIRLVEAEAFLG